MAMMMTRGEEGDLRAECELELSKLMLDMEGGVVLTSSGFAALQVATFGLRQAGLIRQLGVPTLGCRAAYDAARISSRLGWPFEVRLVDVEDGLGPVVTPGVDAYVVQHLFGALDDVQRLGKSVVIEDRTHAPRGLSGRRGRAVVWSFGRGKYLDAGGGGAVWFEDRRIADYVRKVVEYDGSSEPICMGLKFPTACLVPLLDQLAGLVETSEARMLVGEAEVRRLGVQVIEGYGSSWYRPPYMSSVGERVVKTVHELLGIESCNLNAKRLAESLRTITVHPKFKTDRSTWKSRR